ncbi:uncharacterized protein LOC124156313 isoform X2 [Ischnura elegans]|uniref:uncharacterized protein LOC124156313 isoform X2 n=1 Tax=Ischnura elegans TaxID=197161 RepID=UPI001ED88D02|nr:uncharacterized protein LOC124156313 isoform X2 [Ischnura elegans]
MATSSPFACAKVFINLLTLAAVFSQSTGLGYEPSPEYHGVHKHMSVDDLRNVFQVDHHDQVPEYQVISIRSRRSRRSTEDHHAVHLEAFGRPFHLSLRPNGALFSGGALRVWTAHANGSSAEGVHYEEVPQGEIGELYQDLENEAALLVHRDPHNGALLVDGTIGSNLVVKPAPKSVRWRLLKSAEGKGAADGGGKGERAGRGFDKWAPHPSAVGGKEDDDEMFLDQEGEEGQEAVGSRGFPFGRRRFDYDLPAEEGGAAGEGVVAADGGGGAESPKEEGQESKKEEEQEDEHSEGLHVVYKRSARDIDAELSDYAFMEPDQNQNPRRRKSRSIQKREAPYVIYPEILVIVDYDGYRLHGGDNVQIKRYFVSFWNGVDLRYKLLKGPKIRISIAGIIISRGRDATPYLERNRVGRDAIDSAAALTDMGKYLFRERRLPVYDIAVAVTKYDMCRRRKGGRCTKGTAGFAYVGGACVVNKRLEKVNSVAIIEDTGGFSGIIVAAHEVGHLLGAVHDGSPPPSYLGGPGAEKCRWEDGFIMSDLRHTERGFKWSPCSIASFHHFLNGETATCLYNSPHEDESLPRVLPGKLLSLDAQCRKDRGTSACFKDERVCAQLFCFDSGSGYCVAYRPAAEGSPCGDGQYCINGRCVAEHENIIPDYTQIMPSYVSRHGGDGGEETLATRPRPVFAPLANNVTHRSSPWSGFWEKSSTTPLSPYHYTFSTTSTTPRTTTTAFPRYSFTFKPYHYSSTTTLSPYTKPTFPTRYTFPSTLQHNNFYSTPKPYSPPPKPYSQFAKPYSPPSASYYPASPSPIPEVTPFPKYVFSTPKPYRFGQDINTSHQKPPSPFQNPYQHLTSSSTTTTTAKPLKVHGKYDGTDDRGVCEDKAQAVGGGSMSCADFLTRYGSQYCDYQYILRNCCASQRAFCSHNSQR